MASGEAELSQQQQWSAPHWRASSHHLGLMSPSGPSPARQQQQQQQRNERAEWPQQQQETQTALFECVAVYQGPVGALPPPPEAQRGTWV